ncbi:MAG: ArsR family transcriptional regulator [Desulfobacteraceae bacterium]|nr:ArsR family transcriptional regulator [Desulfobacteraceae bacterium]
MNKTLFSGIIQSKLKIRLLLRFFLNPDSQAYLRQLSSEFNVSSNAVRTELNHLAGSNLITPEKQGRKIWYRANRNHPLFPELGSMARKVLGVDQVIDSIANRLGNIEKAFLLDDYAEGKDTGIIDLLLIGDIDNYHLHDLTQKTERYINRRIRHLVMTRSEFDAFEKELAARPHLLIWEK